MSVSTLEPLKPRSRLDILATVVTWVFWFAVLATGLRVILALFGQHPWFGFGGPAGGSPAVCLETAPPLLQHAGNVTWNVNWAHWPASWGVSWPVVWFGLGLIIFARVMRVSAGMRADLEGTV